MIESLACHKSFLLVPKQQTTNHVVQIPIGVFLQLVERRHGFDDALVEETRFIPKDAIALHPFIAKPCCKLNQHCTERPNDTSWAICLFHVKNELGSKESRRTADSMNWNNTVMLLVVVHT